MKRFGYTTSGPRKHNEDYYSFETVNDSDIFCVADGVGGSLCGEFASKFSIEQFIKELEFVDHPNLKAILQNVNEKLIFEANSRKECKGMATTFTAAFINKQLVQLIHTGDSRLYLLRGNGLRQLTEDHTEVKRLINEGVLSKEDSINYSRKNVLDSALGTEKELQTTFLRFEWQYGDRILISTDGFHGVFSKN